MWAETENISEDWEKVHIEGKSGYPPCPVLPGAISGDLMVHRWLVITLLTRNLRTNSENFDIV